MMIHEIPGALENNPKAAAELLLTNVPNDTSDPAVNDDPFNDGDIITEQCMELHHSATPNPLIIGVIKPRPRKIKQLLLLLQNWYNLIFITLPI